MALLASPVTAAAARAGCDHDGPVAMEGMDMSAMPTAARADGPMAGVDPCCDHTGKHKKSDKSCAKACAASCAIVVAPPVSMTSNTLVYTRASVSLARLVSVRAFDPAGPERPPKSIV